MTLRSIAAPALLLTVGLLGGCTISPYRAPVVDRSMAPPPRQMAEAPPPPSSETIPLQSRNDIRPLGPNGAPQGPYAREERAFPPERRPEPGLEQGPEQERVQGLAQRPETAPPEAAEDQGAERRREPRARDTQPYDRSREAASSGMAETDRPKGSPAVLALLSDAGRQARSGSLDGAAASLERAVRIDPRNAMIWSRIAEIRLQQGQPQQAENLAKKSNTLAGRDPRLQARNWHIIAQARRQSGDGTGAEAAEQTAADLEGR